MELGRLNCAGQFCDEREECRRYRIRLAKPESEPKVFEWASFDLERLLIVGECPVFVKFRDA